MICTNYIVLFLIMIFCLAEKHCRTRQLSTTMIQDIVVDVFFLTCFQKWSVHVLKGEDILTNSFQNIREVRLKRFIEFQNH